MVLFKLPQELAQFILNEWVNDGQSISALDVACSSEEERREFLHMLRNPQFQLLVPTRDKDQNEHCAVFVKWLFARQVKVETLVISEDNIAAIAAITFLKLPSVTTLKVKNGVGERGCVMDAKNFGYLLKRCPSLTCLSYADRYMPDGRNFDSESRALLLAPDIPLRSLMLEDCPLSEAAIRSVVFCFRRTLKGLNIAGAKLSDAALEFIALNCPSLETFNVEASLLSAAAILKFCEAAGATLTRIALIYFRVLDDQYQQDDFLCQLADRLPHAESIKVESLHLSTARSFQHVLDCCPNILQVWTQNIFELTLNPDIRSDRTSASLFASFQYGSAKVIIPFLTRLPFKITEFQLSKCVELSVDVVVPFVKKHGATVQILYLELSTDELPNVSSDGAAVLINGCTNAKEMHLTNWHGLNIDIIDRHFNADQVNWSTLSISGCPMMNDDALAKMLGLCSNVQKLILHDCEMVTDRSLDTFVNHRHTLRSIRPLFR